MRLNESVEDGIVIFVLKGEIDFHYAPILRSLLRIQIRKQCPALVLDLTDVSWIDSTGIALIIEYLRDSSKYGGKLCVAGVNGPLKSIFEVVRLHTLISSFPSREEAKEALLQGNVAPPKAALFGQVAD